jgi:hypothetical protein
MLLQIVTRTPVWVWGLLVALIALGVWQSLPRQLPARRALVMPLLLLTLSLIGVLSTFAAAALLPVVAWFAGVAFALAAGRSLVRPRGARWDAAAALFHVPGSWLPLLLILALFAIKYGVGITLALHPGLVRDTAFDLAVGLAYGVFSGLFLARAASLWQLRTIGAAVAAA